MNKNWIILKILQCFNFLVLELNLIRFLESVSSKVFLEKKIKLWPRDVIFLEILKKSESN